jgi:hypothetical protein
VTIAGDLEVRGEGDAETEDAIKALERREALLARVGRSSLAFVLLACVPLGAVAASGVSEPLLRSLGGRVEWLSIAAVGMAFLAAASCATRWRVRPTRLLAFAFGIAGFYMLWVLAAFSPTRHEWLAAERVLWPAIPLAYVLWARTALNVAYHLRPDPTVGGMYAPIQVIRRWSRWPVRTRWASVPTLEVPASWVIGVTLAVVGLVKPEWFIHPQARVAAESWRRWTYTPGIGLYIEAVWGFTLVATATVLLAGSWRSRGHPLPPGLLARGRWGARASAVFLVVEALILWRATSRDFSEALIDALLAVGILVYALLTLDSEQYESTLAAYSTLTKRAITAAGWLLLVLLAAHGYAGTPLARGFFVALLVMAYPLAPIWLRAFEGIGVRPATAPAAPISSTDVPVSHDSMAMPASLQDASVVEDELSLALDGPAAWKPLDQALKVTPTAEETDGLRAALAGSTQKFAVVDLRPELVEWACACLESISAEEFRQLGGELEGGRGNQKWIFGEPPEGKRRDALTFFIDHFPALEFGTHSRRAQSFIRLVYETARDHPRVELEPTSWRWLRSFCLERGIFSTESPEARRAEELEMNRMRLYRRGKNGMIIRPGEGYQKAYSLEELETMDLETLTRLLRNTASRQDETRRKARYRALLETLPEVRRLWIEALGAPPAP